jgi:hypothetical protein
VVGQNSEDAVTCIQMGMRWKSLESFDCPGRRTFHRGMTLQTSVALHFGHRKTGAVLSHGERLPWH